MHKIATKNMSKNGFKPFFKQSHFPVTPCGGIINVVKEQENTGEKDVFICETNPFWGIKYDFSLCFYNCYFQPAGCSPLLRGD